MSGANIGKPRTRWTELQARAELTKAERSGVTLREYSLNKGIDPQRLYVWRRKLEGMRDHVSAPTASSPAGFLPVRVAESASALRPASRQGFEVVVAGGRVLRVSDDFDPAALKRLVEALEECCQ